LHHQNVVNFDSLGGDSGGPYYMAVGASSAKAYGIHIHSTDPPAVAESWFSTYEWAGVQLSQEWGIVESLCITSLC
jgi:hypothetical protein